MDLGHTDSASSVGFVNLAVIDSVHLGLLICKMTLPSFYTSLRWMRFYIPSPLSTQPSMTYVKCSINSFSILFSEHFFFTPVRTLEVIGSHCLFASLPRPWQLLFYFLPLWIYLFSAFHKNRIIQYVACYVWSLSMSIFIKGFLFEMVTYNFG